MLARTIMVQGTASNVGKSIVTTALCRILKRRGYRVAPFKAQNMANNSYVTVEGGEIGRAQAVQAFACGVEPSQLMNPVLLKPSSDKTSQVVLMGRPSDTLSAQDYQKKKNELMPIVESSLQKLREQYDVVVIEGAGSPAEINMKHNDIVNMRVARAVKAPVILVGDIDKGGVFAQIVGTYELLDPEEKNLVKAFIINKFRGDKDILLPGIDWIEQRTGKKCLGVIPMIKDLAIDEEDGVVLDEKKHGPAGTDAGKILIHVIHLPRISNFTDFEALSREPDVHLQFIETVDRTRIPDLLIIPGTKSTVGDLLHLRSKGFEPYIQRCLSAGVTVLGICGGYQMLGKTIEDPHQVESPQIHVEGMGLVNMRTIFRTEKKTVQVKAVHDESGLTVSGYEIHMGESYLQNGNQPLFRIIERQGQTTNAGDGIVLENKEIGKGGTLLGTYIHGLFDDHRFRRYFLDRIREKTGLAPFKQVNTFEKISAYDRLADECEQNLDLTILDQILDEQLT